MSNIEYKRIEGRSTSIKKSKVQRSREHYPETPYKIVEFRLDSDPLNESFSTMRRDMLQFEQDVSEFISKLEAEGSKILYKSEPEYNSESSYYDSFNYFMYCSVTLTPTSAELEAFEKQEAQEAARAKAQRKFEYEKLKKEFENDPR